MALKIRPKRVGLNSIKFFAVIALVVQPLALLNIPSAYAVSGENTVCASGCEYTTIQAAVNGETAGATVTVGNGVYTESVTVNKSLILKAESSAVRVIGGPSYSNGAFIVTASNVTIDGFTVGDTAQKAVVGIDLGSSSGATIKNVVTENNQRGISLSGASNVTIENVQVRNNYGDPSNSFNNNAGIWGDNVNTISITGSTLNGHKNTAINLAASQNITISNNSFTNNGNTAVIWGGSNLTFSNNTGSGFTGSGIYITGFNGATVSGNTLTNGAAASSALTLTNPAGATSNATVTGNTFSGFLNGVNVYLVSDTAQIHKNNFAGVTNGVVSLNGAPSPNATQNWWGSASGPSDANAADGSTPATNAGTGVGANGNVNYANWCSNVTCIAAPQPTAPQNGGTQPGNTVTFGWNTVTDATGYEIRYSKSPARTPNANDGELNGSDAVTTTEVAATTHTLTMPSSGTWFWQVRAKVGTAAGAWSNIWSATTANHVVVPYNTSAGENQPGWMFNRDAANATPIAFSDEAASMGTSSLKVLPLSSTPAHKFIGELFAQTPISSLNQVSYDFKIGAGGNASQASQFYMSVYANFASSSPTKFYDCRYNIVPTTGSTSAFTTVSFNPYGTYDVTQRGDSPQTCPAKPIDMGAGAVIRAFALNMGDTSAGDQGLGGYFDKFILNTSAGSTLYDFEADTTPPAVPTSLAWQPNGGSDKPSGTVTNVENGTLKWQSSDADHYKYYFWTDIPGYFEGQANAWSTDNASYFTNTATGGSIWTGFAGKQGTYFFCVKAVDLAGNESACSDTFSVRYDSTAPAAPTLVTASPYIANGATKTLTWNPSASSDVAYYEYAEYNNASPSSDTTPPSWVKQVNGTTTTDTAWGSDIKIYWRVRAVDHAGNVSPWSETRLIVTDRTAPVVTITSVGFNTLTDTIDVEGTTDSEDDAVTVEQGGVEYPAVVTPAKTWSVSLPATGLTGTQTLTVFSRDIAGNITNPGVQESVTIPSSATDSDSDSDDDNQSTGGSPLSQRVATTPLAIQAQLTTAPQLLAFAPAATADGTPTVDSTITPQQDSPSILGTETAKATSGDKAVAGTSTDGQNLWSFWWILPLIAALAAGVWWIIAAIRRRQAEEV